MSENNAIARVIAESDIRRFLARYLDAAFRQDEAAYVPCWAKNAEFHVMGKVMKGRDEIVNFWKSLLPSMPIVWHVPNNICLEIDGTTASSRGYINDTSLFNGQVLFILGISHDRYIIEDGQWRIAFRRWDTIYAGPADMSGKFFDIPKLGPPPQAPDPSIPTLAH
jgi:hypothetical protein